jgi:hypothetical protein
VEIAVACGDRTQRVETNIVRDVVTFLRVEITLCVYKLHSACVNHTRACRNHTGKCQNYSRVCRKHTQRVKSDFACGNCTLHVETNIGVLKSHSCVFKLHSACINETLRV